VLELVVDDGYGVCSSLDTTAMADAGRHDNRFEDKWRLPRTNFGRAPPQLQYMAATLKEVGRGGRNPSNPLGQELQDARVGLKHRR
jgi:hypothetical protein